MDIINSISIVILTRNIFFMINTFIGLKIIISNGIEIMSIKINLSLCIKKIKKQNYLLSFNLFL